MTKIVSEAHMYVSNVDATVSPPTAVAVTSITKAAPPVVTPATMPPGIAAGDYVRFQDTGEPLLDGYAFKVATVSATGFLLPDVDGTKFNAAVATGTLQALTFAGGEVDLMHVCLAAVTIAGQAPDSIALDDMCGSSTKLGSPKPPTFTFSGLADAGSPGYRNLWRASILNPKPVVWVLFDFGPEGGYAMGPAQIGEMSKNAATNQGLQFSGSGQYTEMPTYSWAL
jgi:hypothetical protein